MKTILPLLAICLVGCSEFGTSTTMYYPNGQRAFTTSGDNAGISVNMPGAGSFSAITNTHSSVVAARGDAYSKFVSTAGAAVSQAGPIFARTAKP